MPKKLKADKSFLFLPCTGLRLKGKPLGVPGVCGRGGPWGWPTASECTPRPGRPNFHGFHQASDWVPSSYPNGTVYFSAHAASAHRITSQGRVPEKQKITYYRPPECQGGGVWGARPPHRHCPGAARPTATWRLSCSGSPPRDPSEGARTG